MSVVNGGVEVVIPADAGAVPMRFTLTCIWTLKAGTQSPLADGEIWTLVTHRDSSKLWMTWRTGHQATAYTMEHVGASRVRFLASCMSEPLIAGFATKLARNARLHALNHELKVGPVYHTTFVISCDKCGSKDAMSAPSGKIFIRERKFPPS